MEEAQRASVAAECPSCSKRYRVADAQHKYTCKQCGVGLRVVAAPRPVEIDALTCVACRAINPLGSRKCAECGAVLFADVAELERKDALREIANAIRAMRGNRNLYVAAALFHGLMALIVGPLAFERSDGALWILFGVDVVMALFFAAGAIWLGRAPMFWSVLLAAICTLDVAAGLLRNDFSPGSVTWAGITWWRVVATITAKRVMARHPEIPATRWFQRETGAIATTRSARELRQRAAESIGRRRMLAAAGIACLVVLAAFGAYRLLSAPSSFGNRAERFASTWNDYGLAGLQPLFAAEERAANAAALAAVANLHGWLDGVPKIEGAGRVDDFGSERKHVSFKCRDGEVVSVWKLSDGEWLLREVRTPTAALARNLRDAWNRSDLAGVCAFFGTPERVEPALRKTIAKRGWNDGAPQAGEPRIEELGDGLFRANFATDAGPLVVTWRFTNGRWSALTLEPPPER